MEAGTLPPNWQELIEHSSEMATTEDVFKADTLLSDQKMVDATDQLTYPFSIVTDHHNKQRPQRCAANEITPIMEHAVSEGDRLPHSSPPPHCDLTSHAAAKFFDINVCANIGRPGAAKKHWPPQPDFIPWCSNKYLRNARNNETAREWSPLVPAFARTTVEGQGNIAKAQSPRII